METMVELMIEYGSLGIFLAFMVWQYTTMQKRLDSLVDKFQEQIDKMRGENSSQVEELRARYDTVIDNYNRERSELRAQLLHEIGEMSRKSDLIALTQENTISLVEDLKDRIRAVETLLDKTCHTLIEMQQEARLRELADKAIAARG